jgi:NADH-ubiquinone oxidoreductase chain 1
MTNNNLMSNISDIFIGLIDVLIILLPVLLAVAFMTLIERKNLGAFQRRCGPNNVGVYGILNPFADALKLIFKETVIPSQSNKVLFFLAPVATLVFSLLGWAIIPFGPGLAISDFSMGILYTVALSSLGVYGVLFAG